MTLQTFQFWFENILLGYFGGINVLYTILLIVAAFHIFSRIKEIREEDTTQILKSDSLPTILFVIPIHNEAENVIPNISNIMLLSYRYKQVIAVNDGSDDNTMEILMKELDLVEIPKYYVEEIPTQQVKKVYRSRSHPEVTVIDKEKGRKFDAVNAAINAAPNPFFVVLDADTFVDSKQFESLVRPILTSTKTIGVGASIRIMNGCTLNYNRVTTAQFPKEFIPAVQSLEYLRAFCLRDGLDIINGNFIISGAFSIFPRDLIVQAGGFGPSCGEDVEIVVRLHRLMLEAKIPYRIQYFSDPVAFTVAPTKLGELGQQRSRWHLGLLESIWFHKRICMNPKYRVFGIFGFPFWLLGETLEPFFEAIGWIYLISMWCIGSLHVPFFLMLFASTVGYTALYTIFALCLEEFSYRKYPSLKSLTMLLLANFLENIGYRQLTVFWRLRAFFMFIKKFGEVRKSSRFINDLMKKAHENFRKKMPEGPSSEEAKNRK